MKSLDQRISELEKKVTELEGQVPAQQDSSITKSDKKVIKEVVSILKRNHYSFREGIRVLKAAEIFLNNSTLSRLIQPYKLPKTNDSCDR